MMGGERTESQVRHKEDRGLLRLGEDIRGERAGREGSEFDKVQARASV
jgi:hypothetical protein